VAHEAAGAATTSRRGWRLGFGVVVEAIIGVVLSLALLGFMLLGNYARYVADDYGTALAVRLRGFWAQQVAAYQLTDGHFMATALQTALAYVNPVVVRVLPGVLVVAWVVALLAALRHLIPEAGRLGRFVIAAGVVYTTLRVTPSPFLALYWMTASVAFVVPLILAALVVWLISRRSSRSRPGTAYLICIAVVALIASGEAEIYTVAAFMASTLAVVIALSGYFRSWRVRLRPIVAAWAGAVLGLGLEVASPGNALRSAAISKLVSVPRPSVVALPLFTFVRVAHFVHALVFQHWRGLLALALLVGLVAVRSGALPRLRPRAGLISAGLVAAGTTIVVWGAMAPAALEYGAAPPLYDQLVIVFACVLAVVASGWLAGRLLRGLVEEAGSWLRARSESRTLAARAATVMVAAVVVAGPIGTLAMMRHDLPAYRAYAAGKDAQTAALEAAHAAGRSSVTAPPLVNVESIGIFDHTPLEEAIADPTYWVNEDTAEYYGLQTMTVSH